MTDEQETAERQLNRALSTLLDEAGSKATKYERERAKAVARGIVLTGLKLGQVGDYIAEQIERTGSKPEPPVEKPMTIPRLMRKLTTEHRIHFPNWDAVEKDLESLVNAVQENQIRRDANSLCCGPCKDALLKAAGLQ